MSPKDSQINMHQHSEIKIRLLKEYLDSYLNILNRSKYVGDIHIYDLFCGEGIYQNDGKGSPIIILETIKDIHFANIARQHIGGKFNCYFNDNNALKIENLKRNIAERHLHYPEIGLLEFSVVDYRLILRKLHQKLSGLKNDKAFIFIDPYGYKDIRVSDIKDLLKTGKTEVLLFLPTQFMFRFESKGTPESLKVFISELMPSDEWPKSVTGIDFIKNLTTSFRAALGNKSFVDSFIIGRDLNQFFCLFFFTNHIYGFEKMLEAKWKIDKEEGRGWNSNQEFTLFNQTEKQANTIEYEEKLREFLNSARTNGEVYRFQLENGHLTKHTNDILKKIQNEGKLISTNKDGSFARKSAFYICYENFNKEPDKIILKIK